MGRDFNQIVAENQVNVDEHCERAVEAARAVAPVAQVYQARICGGQGGWPVVQFARRLTAAEKSALADLGWKFSRKAKVGVADSFDYSRVVGWVGPNA